MPCDISSTLQDSCRAVFGLKFFNTIFSSTIWTAILITVIIIILLLTLIPVKENTETKILFKFMFYTALSVIGVLFLHGGSLKINNQESIDNNISTDLLDRIEGKENNIVDSKRVEVTPLISGGDEKIFDAFGV